METDLKLEIKDVVSPDIDEIWKCKPTNPDKILFLLELNIGVSGDNKSELFQVLVGTPLGFLKSDKVVISTRATLILKKFSWKILNNCLNDILKNCSGTSWQESVTKLQRYFMWEYEDYKG